MYGSVTIQLWPRFDGTTELALELDVIDIHFTGDIAINGPFASANITTFLVEKIEIPVTTMKGIYPTALKTAFI